MSTPFHRYLNEIKLVLQRRGSGFNDDFGRYHEATPTSVEIMANIQPVYLKNELNSGIGGETTTKIIKLYSRQEIKLRKEGVGGWDSDRFIYPVDCELYEVFHVEHRRMRTLMHYKAMAKRVETT